MEDELTKIFKGRRPQLFENGRRPLRKIMQPKTLTIKNNDCGTVPGYLVWLFVKMFLFYFLTIMVNSMLYILTVKNGD